MKKWNINALMMNDESTFDYDFKVTYEGQEVTLFDKTTLHDKWLYKYTSFCLSTPSFYDPGSESYIDTCPDIDAAITLLHALYTQWKADRGHSFAKTYAALMAEYNPLWNVDGVEGLIFKDTHTGTDTNAKSGTDVNQASGSDTDRVTGSDSVASSGTDTDTLSGSDTYDKDITKEETTRTGSESNAKTGNDTDTRSVATFDSAGVLGPESSNRTDYLSTDTKTYNSVKDSHTLDAQDKTTYGKIDTFVHGKTDTTTYGKIDSLQFGRRDETTYGLTDTETRNLTDEHIEMKIRQGNIGVTKSTDLVESEISLRERLDHLIDYFIADFIRAYCIL